MERGSELSKTVACFIVERILLDENGLKYMCEKPERLNAINTVLSFMIKNKPSARLLKHIIRSYYRLAEEEEGKKLLKDNLPDVFKEPEFIKSLDESSRKWLMSLNHILKEGKNVINNMNGNISLNNINMNNNGMMDRIGIPMNMNNNPNLGNNIPMNPNMILLNKMNLQNQGFMMPQQPNDFNFQAYGDQYMNNGIIMGNQNSNNGFRNLNYFGNPNFN